MVGSNWNVKDPHILCASETRALTRRLLLSSLKVSVSCDPMHGAHFQRLPAERLCVSMPTVWIPIGPLKTRSRTITYVSQTTAQRRLSTGGAHQRSLRFV